MLINNYKRITLKERADLTFALGLEQMTIEELRLLKDRVAKFYISRINGPTDKLHEEWFAIRRIIDDEIWGRVC